MYLNDKKNYLKVQFTCDHINKQAFLYAIIKINH